MEVMALKLERAVTVEAAEDGTGSRAIPAILLVWIKVCDCSLRLFYGDYLCLMINYDYSGQLVGFLCVVRPS
jgi:hypothetical protein